MAYNYFPAAYQPYYPQQNPQGNQSNSIIWVQGEAGAKSYMVAPNQTVQLWDSEAQVIYLKSADASGMPSIKVLEYSIRENGRQNAQNGQEGAYATREDVDYLKGEIEALRAKLEAFKEEGVK